MNDFLHYLLEVNILLVLFAGAHALFFRHTPHHLANRAVLNASVLLALFLPFIEWSAPQAAQITVWLDPFIIGQNSPAAAETGVNWISIVGFAYFAGVLVITIMTLQGLPALMRLMKKRSRRSNSRFFEVVEPGLAPGSFMRTVFLDSNLTPTETEAITAHELVHIREFHTFDHLLFRALTIVCWFNPIAYLMQRMLMENHEFRADFMAGKSLENYTIYSEILLSRTLGVSRFPTLSFSNKNLLKRRVMMITDPIRHKNKAWRYAFLPFLLVPAMLIHSCSKDSTPTEMSKQEQVSKLTKEMATEKIDEMTKSAPTAPQKNEDGIYTLVDEMPSFPGGQSAMMNYLGENIHYPDAAKSEGPGTVFISFVIDEQGDVTQLEVMKSPDPALSAAALEAIGSMPQWSSGKQDGVPVKVQYVLPIRFALKE